ncbi:unnamed protein product [Prunus armeniaca]
MRGVSCRQGWMMKWTVRIGGGVGPIWRDQRAEIRGQWWGIRGRHLEKRPPKTVGDSVRAGVGVCREG